MRYTNKHNLPEPFLRAILDSKYSKGDAEFSCTELSKPVQLRALESRFWDHPDMVVDVADMVFALLGQGVHAILEAARARGDIVEERLFLDIAGTRISGAYDRLVKTGRLQDYKVTSAWSFIYETKFEWIAQMSILSYLVYRNKGKVPTGCDIVGIVRDWNWREPARNPEYPQAQAKVLPIKTWSIKKTEDYIIERIVAHREATKLKPRDLPECTEQERWAHAGKYAVMLKATSGKKPRSRRNLDTEADAEKFIQDAEIGKTHRIEYRPGESVRCERFCNVKRWCVQYANSKKVAVAA